ncbi:MAG: HAMP domain-containing protein [Clostridia bacterium]|nr:HAMP domain-containing protein [Clostridia bacterium]
MKKRIHLSITTNIFISFLALTIVMIGFLWSLEALFFNKVYKATKESEVEIASNLIVESIGKENIDDTVEQIVREYDLCIQVYRCKDEVLLYNPECKSNGCIIHGLTNDNLYFRWLNGANNGTESKFSEVSKSENGSDYLVFARVVTGTDGVVYLLVLNASIEPMQSTISAIRTMLVLISVLFLVFASAISFVLAKRLSSPIIKINNNAKKLAKANYNTEFSIDGPIEIRQLAKTLNIATKELGKLDSMQKELIANISHDLRTPLTMISGYAEVMRDIPDEITPENLQVIIDESARLTSLVNDLLNVSKLQAGTQTMNIQRMNLTRAVRQTVERYARFKEHNDFNIIFDYTRDVYINADEIRLLQVVYNLINNAINYTGQDKTVTVTQTVEDGIVRISVIDSGEGIKEEDLPLIWDRYYKVDKIHKRAVIGTGLGLSIVKNILLLHGSRFGVSSEVNKGTIFWFEFKIVD